MQLRLCSFLFTTLLACSAPSRAESRDACARLRDLVPKVAHARGLAAAQTIRCEELSRAELEKVKQRQYIPARDSRFLAWEEIAYKAIGLVPAAYPYERCLIRDIVRDLLASYEPARGAVLIPSDGFSSDSVLAHEIVHALQDHHFHISRRERKISSTDEALGFYAVVEGDALRIQNLFEQPKAHAVIESDNGSAAEPLPDECRLPETIARSFDFPYSFGPIFVARVIEEKDGAARLDAMLKEPPRTSAQILHRAWNPAWARDRATRICVPSLWRLAQERVVYSDSLGEYMTGVLLSVSAPRSAALRAAREWLSDRLEVVRARNATQVRWRTLWQSEAGARSFQSLFNKRLAELYHLDLKDEAPAFSAVSADGAQLRLQRRESAVLFAVQVK